MVGTEKAYVSLDLLVVPKNMQMLKEGDISKGQSGLLEGGLPLAKSGKLEHQNK